MKKAQRVEAGGRKCYMTPNYKKCMNVATHIVSPREIEGTPIVMCDECLSFWGPRLHATQIAPIMSVTR